MTEPSLLEQKLVNLETDIFKVNESPRIAIETLADIIFRNLPEEDAMALSQMLRDKIKVGKTSE